MIGVKWDVLYLRVGTNKRVLQPSLRRVAGLRHGIFRTNVFGIGSAGIEEAFSSEGVQERVALVGVGLLSG